MQHRRILYGGRQELLHVADFYAMGLYTFQFARVSGMRAHTSGYECACDAHRKAPVGVPIITFKGMISAIHILGNIHIYAL